MRLGLTDLVLDDSLPGIDQLKAYFQLGFYRDFASNPGDPFRKDLVRNDLLDWAPQTPTLLFASSNRAITRSRMR
ncbi:lipase [Xanthomonas fragariae]|uniref:Lipase n=1 Tax=Xanthomonas fragariae TaxID=48664 RepID=A0A1Y6H3T0_9XANT|nr:hypothetical protein BER92_17875 [Xanthomonas fragariae]ENZ95457.1 lipase [Xanthomonas fragariae LMG 25863]AOD19631.1 hypothetical protein BER93_17930 [Xanthomonas fragariae]SMQ96890.1 lipase [Xanthomonas fragariae]SMQ97588.1 hypothetical protein PD885_00318 [Xanthomonas fragariae]